MYDEDTHDDEANDEADDEANDEACYDATMDALMAGPPYSFSDAEGWAALETRVAKLISEFGLEMVREAFIGHQQRALDEALEIQRLLNDLLTELGEIPAAGRPHYLAERPAGGYR